MELSDVLKVVQRRWWLIAVTSIVALIAAMMSFLNQPKQPTLYTSTVRFMISTPLTGDPIDYEDAVSLGVGALVDWSQTSVFADEVNRRLEGLPYTVDEGAFQAEIVRSMLTLSVARQSPEEAEAVMQAAIDTLVEDAATYYPYEGDLEVVPLDDITVTVAPPSLFSQLDPLIRLMIGVVVGIGLAFLVEYLDPTLHDGAEAKALGFDILAEIPRSK